MGRPSVWGIVEGCLIVTVHPRLAVANLVGKLKGKSSYVLRRDHFPAIHKWLWCDHFWNPSYCVVSTGGASLDVVAEYVRNQNRPL
jgi:putative transposase